MGSYIFYCHMVTHYIAFHCMMMGVIKLSFKMNKVMWYNSENELQLMRESNDVKEWLSDTWVSRKPPMGRINCVKYI